jgi:hypothetical protein
LIEHGRKSGAIPDRIGTLDRGIVETVNDDVAG